MNKKVRRGVNKPIRGSVVGKRIFSLSKMQMEANESGRQKQITEARGKLI